jgi:hypothetical protein
MTGPADVHDAFDRVEEQVNQALDGSLDPAGPGVLYDYVAGMGEFRRVLRPGGRAVIYQMFATSLLEPAEATLPTLSRDRCYRPITPPRPRVHTAWMPRSCSSSDMVAAAMS